MWPHDTLLADFRQVVTLICQITYNSSMATPSVFQVPPINKRKRIPMRTIRAIAKHIAEKFDPEEIILFGSHAYGKPTAWSDVDLLVVMDIPKGNELEKSLEIGKSLPSLMFGLDDVPFTDTASFHCQQCAEKYLKAFLTDHLIRFERSHVLADLLVLCLPVDKDFKKIANDLISLEGYAVAIRYPGATVSWIRMPSTSLHFFTYSGAGFFVWLGQIIVESYSDEV